jgi:8-oxo-dGTP pyrophosphatase MutT (NUDIX family)
MSGPSTPPPLIPAAAVILLRDTAGGFEVLMQQRREEQRAFAGVLAFPGGKLCPVDHTAEFAGLADLPPESAYEPARRLAALRELFEECGILLARNGHGALERSALLAERERLDREPGAWPAALRHSRLRFAADLLTPWARWMTPEFAPRRFDSTMFLARAPLEQPPIDGREAVAHLWARPSDLLADAEAGRRQIVFVTRMNLLRLAQFASVDEALEASARGPHAAIAPWRIETPGGPMLRIPDWAPYPVREMPFATSSVAIELERLARGAQPRS